MHTFHRIEILELTKEAVFFKCVQMAGEMLAGYFCHSFVTDEPPYGTPPLPPKGQRDRDRAGSPD